MTCIRVRVGARESFSNITLKLLRYTRRYLYNGIDIRHIIIIIIIKWWQPVRALAGYDGKHTQQRNLAFSDYDDIVYYYPFTISHNV